MGRSLLDSSSEINKRDCGIGRRLLDSSSEINKRDCGIERRLLDSSPEINKSNEHETQHFLKGIKFKFLVKLCFLKIKNT